MKHLYPLILGSLSALGSAQAQYDTVFVGTAETISNGPFETPFPTGGAVASRTQYLFYSSQLTGIPPNQDIYGIVMDVLDSDPPGTTVNLSISLKNTTAVCWPTMDPTGWTTCLYDSTMHLDAGTMAFMFNVSPFQWNGTWNVSLEFCMERNGPPGVDPRVALDTGFVCYPAYYAHDTIDGPCGALLTTTAPIQGSLDSRPVIGLIVNDIGLSAADERAAPRLALYPNPAKDRLRLRVLDATDDLTAQVFSATGALVLDRSKLIPDPAGFVDLALPSLPSGCYLLRIASEGAAVWEQRFVVE